MRIKTLNLQRKPIDCTWVDAILIRFDVILFTVFLAVIVSALGIVFFTNQARDFSANISSLHNQNNQLYVNGEKLLIEKTTLLRQSLLYDKAVDDLGMILPDVWHVVDISE